MAPRSSFPTECFLQPDLSAWVDGRCAALGLRFSTYVQILTHNEVTVGKASVRKLKQETLERVVRERRAFSVPASLARAAGDQARRAGGTISQLIEALIERDRAGGQGGLTIWPAP